VIVRVSLPLPIGRSFDYETDFNVSKGCRLLVPFGLRRLAGYCVETDVTPSGKPLKKVIKKIDEIPVLTDELFALARWMEKYYFTVSGMALKMILPSDIKSKAGKLKSSDPVSSPGEPLGGSDYSATPAASEIPEEKNVCITGNIDSAKNMIYGEIWRTTKKKGQVLFLIPRKENINEWLEVVKSFRFACFHSGISPGARYGILKDAESGCADVVVGTRSAVFTPFRKLSLIVIIKPQDSAFFEEQHPQYSAVEVAAKRAELAGAQMLEVSETMTVGQYYRIKNNSAKSVFADFPAVVGGSVCDTGEVEVDFGISKKLLGEIRKNADEGKKVLLYLPKGGWAGSLVCSACGYAAKCEKCGRKLVVSKFALYCPRCRKSYPLPKTCPDCGRKKLKNRGLGREHVAAYLRRELQNLSVYAVNIRALPDEKKALFNDFEKGRINVLISDSGFACIKNWEKIGLFAVLDADFALYGGNWKADENTFSFLRRIKYFLRTRGAGTKLFIQTKIAFEIAEDALGETDDFYEKQLQVRKRFNFPPYSRILRLQVSGKKAKSVCGKIASAAGEECLEISEPLKKSASLFEIVLKIKPGLMFSVPQIKGAKISIEEER